MSHLLLTVRDAGVRRGRRDILNHVTVNLLGGEFVAVLGPSGSGKSTLIKALIGLVRLSTGHVLVNGKAQSAHAWQGRLGYVPQDDIVHTGLIVTQALRYAADLRLPKGEHQAVRDTVLRQLGLWDHRHQRISTLSGGQRKRVSLAMELLSDPELLMLDEPTSGLDPALEASMMRLLASLAAKGMLVVATTHAMASLAAASRILVVHGGHIVYDGPPATLCSYFGVPTAEAVFGQLKSHSPVEWFNRFNRVGGRRGIVGS
ncbi:MAG: ABC transporter ATP-binding protein [Candidatus Sericytochromatia bacterium]|nr:ABC transporter ATP-binding protein [Candidatus Sericytochromatia bacterium]